ncbi:MAG TPA: EamA family transporter [Candidatus Baltobacteraceae bacterium]|nr:EamA family transporter [Candidatus Baltobacteraceae bacterium]
MCAIWGTTWLGIKISLHYAPPISGAGLRFIIAGLAMYVVAAAMRKTVPLREMPWKLIAVLAVFLFGLNYVLTYTAETHVSSGLTAVLFGVLPFFMFGMGHYLIGEHTTRMTWLGALLAFAGVAVISLQADVHGSVWYALAAIGAACSSAFANVYAKRHAHNDPLVTLPPSMLLAGIAVAAIGFPAEHPDVHRAFSLPSWGALLYLALAGSGIAFFLNLWLLQRIPAWIVGLSSLIIPVIAVAVGVTFGGEAFGPRELLGAALVIAGVWIALSRSGAAASDEQPVTR